MSHDDQEIPTSRQVDPGLADAIRSIPEDGEGWTQPVAGVQFEELAEELIGHGVPRDTAVDILRRVYQAAAHEAAGPAPEGYEYVLKRSDVTRVVETAREWVQELGGIRLLSPAGERLAAAVDALDDPAGSEHGGEPS